MILDEFIKMEHERVNNFKYYWLRESSHNPDDFPMDMNAGEWDEQLRNYSEDR